MVAGAGEGYVEEVALGVEDVFEVGFVGGGGDAGLGGDDFVVAGYDGYGAEFEAFGQVHGSYGGVTGLDFNGVVDGFSGERGLLQGLTGSGDFFGGADEDSDFVGLEFVLCDALFQPGGYQCGSRVPSGADLDGGGWTVEDGGGSLSFFGVAVYVAYGCA